MNYQKHYNNLISKGKSRILDGYKEKHHIIPKCLGGSDNKNNIVELTAREHFIAHLLLIKIHNKNYKLIKAVSMMCVSSFDHGKNRSKNRLYGWLREQFSIAQSICQSGEKNSQFGTFWINNGSEMKKNKRRNSRRLGQRFFKNSS